MFSLQIVEPGRSAWVEVPTPQPLDHEILIRVQAVTSCPHWDIHIMDGEPMFPGMTLEYPYRLGNPGHEAVGEVVALGQGVTRIKVGDRVVAWRDTGQPRPGFYAQYNTFHEDDVLVVPPHLKHEEIASLELAMCVEVSFQQLEVLGGIKGRSIGISGLGPAGLVAVQLAKAHGAGEVVGFDPMPERRDLAHYLGADRVICPLTEPFPASRSTHALDDAIDMTGLPASIEYLMDRTRRAVLLFGVLREHVRFSSQHLFGPGLTLMGYGDHNRQAAETSLEFILGGQLSLTPLISETRSFREYDEAVDRLRKKQAIKIMFDPWL
jgi:threonine dehydrogenase-like Zn-dependent dehydrogenase